MAIARWNPLQEVDLLQRDMNRLFDLLIPSSTNPVPKNGLSFIPAAEMTQTAEAIHLKLEVPGLAIEDFDIEATEDSLTVKGERKSETKTEKDGVTQTEFRYGKFSRVIPLPGRIDNTKVSAEYKNGILNVVLPKAEAEKNKVVKVAVN